MIRMTSATGRITSSDQFRSFLFVMAALFLVAAAADSNEMKKTTVDVYYETLCPDSIRYLTQTVLPIKMSPLGDYFDLKLYPFGKSTASKDTDGQYTFQCHHGEDECEGNRVHACVLRHSPSAERALIYIKCLLEDNTRALQYTTSKLEGCFSEMGITEEVFHSTLSPCIKSREASDLLFEYGTLTDAVRKPLESVPFTVFDKMVDKERSAQAFSGRFTAIVCNNTAMAMTETEAADAVRRLPQCTDGASTATTSTARAIYASMMTAALMATATV